MAASGFGLRVFRKLERWMKDEENEEETKNWNDYLWIENFDWGFLLRFACKKKTTSKRKRVRSLVANACGF